MNRQQEQQVSYYLEQLIGDERRAACLANDAAPQPKEQAMKHPVHVGRVFTDMEASESDDGELYEITIIRFGKGSESRKQWFPNSNAANLEAASLSFGGAVVMVRPVGEVCAA